MLAVEVIDSYARLLDFKTEWSSFLQTLDNLTPFQMPEWLLTWWPHFGSGSLRVLPFRRDSALVGVIPCFLHEWEGLRQLTLIGSGISDYLDPPLAKEHNPEILACLSAHLKSTSDWDICNWQELSHDSVLRQLQSNEVFAVAAQQDTECSEIRIHECFGEYWEKRPRSLRRNLRRYLEKAESIDTLEFTAVDQFDEEIFNALVRLHNLRWQRQGEAGMIAANRSAKFLADIARKWAPEGRLRFFSLRFQGRVVSVILAFRHANAMFGYLSAFDPEYEALGFGRTLLYHALKYCFDNGYQAWNFLRGSEDYKFLWGAQSIPKCRIIIRRI